jgi:type II secretion system protein G
VERKLGFGTQNVHSDRDIIPVSFRDEGGRYKVPPFFYRHEIDSLFLSSPGKEKNINKMIIIKKDFLQSQKRKGFTLIELLIVVALIGILAALLIPNAMTAMHKSKQKATMKDLTTIGTALTDHVTDRGQTPQGQAGTYSAGDAFYTALCPFYVKVLPTRDKWSKPYYAYTGTSATGQWSCTPVGGPGVDDFIIGSTGRNGPSRDGSFNSADPEAGFFTVSSMQDFNNDLVMWNGTWVLAPKTYTATGT